MSPKILSDFDGVWTDPRKEADAILRHLIEAAAKLAHVPLDQARADFAGFLELVNTNPERYGWAPDGWITAYVDEDPLLLSSGLGMLLDERTDVPGASKYKDAILKEHATLVEFTNQCFLDAIAEFLATEPNQLVQRARHVMDQWLAAGCEVVVVSNSHADKLVKWFRERDIDAREEPGGEIRVRGNAKKYTIASEGGALEFSGRRVCIDRPLYQTALEEENADVVIGDVFSLDLALPYVMRRDGLPGAPRKLALACHPHTPKWVQALKGEGPIDALITDLGDLPTLVDA